MTCRSMKESTSFINDKSAECAMSGNLCKLHKCTPKISTRQEKPAACKLYVFCRKSNDSILDFYDIQILYYALWQPAEADEAKEAVENGAGSFHFKLDANRFECTMEEITEFWHPEKSIRDEVPLNRIYRSINWMECSQIENKRQNKRKHTYTHRQIRGKKTPKEWSKSGMEWNQRAKK